MRMGMRVRVVDGGRRRWRKSLMKTSGHADARVIHVMLHRRVMHRVMMLRRTWNDNETTRRLFFNPALEREPREEKTSKVFSLLPIFLPSFGSRLRQLHLQRFFLSISPGD